ncbi:MAG: hypothetical protein WBW69_08355 [Candidatus Korobacteraceae bacterium]
MDTRCPTYQRTAFPSVVKITKVVPNVITYSHLRNHIASSLRSLIILEDELIIET